MEQAFAGYTLYAISLGAVAAIAMILFAGAIRRRWRVAQIASTGWRRSAPIAALAAGLTAVVVLAFIEVLLFQDYGVHLYEFDVFGILADAALRRDLGIQPAEVARVTAAALALLGAELLLCVAAWKVAAWRNGAIARACGAAMLATIPGGWALFRSGEADIAADRAEFEGALPLGKQLLLRHTTRPFIGVEPRLGTGGYPILRDAAAVPTLGRRSNIVFWVADGLRADMVGDELTPNLMRFAARRDVIRSQRHFSTGHVSEAGIFGLLYGLHGQAFHSFMEQRIPVYPIEVLKRNGYHTFLLASSRLNPYPSDQLVRTFDQVVLPKNDDEAVAALDQYLDARRADHRPYFILAFFYTPHYPFTSAKPHFRRYPLIGPSARTNYMNDVLQADDYFRQAFARLQPDVDSGRTVLLATSDHGEEIRDHGIFGHASATFWNEKIVVPFLLALPGASLTGVRAPSLSSHVDVWPTVFEYLRATPLPAAESYSDGTSLLHSRGDDFAYVSGRFFPYADRPSVLVDHARKYWFRVDGIDNRNRLCAVITRVTDLEDRPVAYGGGSLDTIPAFATLQAQFWRFIEPTAVAREPCLR